MIDKSIRIDPKAQPASSSPDAGHARERSAGFPVACFLFELVAGSVFSIRLGAQHSHQMGEGIFVLAVLLGLVIGLAATIAGSRAHRGSMLRKLALGAHAPLVAGGIFLLLA
jgi:hypothetical protein